MTRFMQEVSGLLDEEVAKRRNEPNSHYWENQAKAEVDKLCKECFDKAIVEEDGAIKWNTNGAYLMDDLCEKLEWACFPFNREATQRKRDAQVERELAEYREQMKNHQYTEEELFEMRAAFGEGEKIVNVFTGEEITL